MPESPLPIPEVVKLKLPWKPMHNWAANEVEIRPTFRDLEPNKAVWALYRRWCLHYNIRRTSKERHERFNIFKKNAREVFEMNQMDPSCQFYLSSSCDEKDLFDWSGDDEMTPTPTERDMKSDEAVLDLYYRWCLYHKILRTPEEMQQRVKYFKMSATHAIKMNKKDPSCLSKWCDKINLRYWSGVEDMTLTPTKGDLESDDALWDLYHRWCLHHKIHRTPEEMKLRFTTFKNTVTHVFEMSQRDTTIQFCLSFGCDETDQPAPEVTVIPIERDLQSGNALLGLYHRYCLYRKIQRTPEEKRQGFNNFKKCVNHVFEKNQKDPSRQFYLGDVCDAEYLPQEPAREVFIGIRPTPWDLESDKALWVLYHRWCLHHNKRRTHEEMCKRFNRFKKHAFKVFELNRKCPDKFAMSHWSDGADLTCCALCSSDEEESSSDEECSSDEEEGVF